MIRLINLVLSCERVVLICGCCTAHLRPQEGITWPLIEQHVKLRTAEVESSMHSYTNYWASRHSTRLYSRENKCLCLTVTIDEERVWEDSKEVSSPHNRLQSSPEKCWSDTQIMTLMLFASLSGLLKHGCVKSAGLRVCAVFHALKLFRQT